MILSAGTFHSPQLLMLSGIGPSHMLKKFNIPLVKNLPVGEVMFDHPGFPGIILKTNITNPFNKISNFLIEGVRWLIKGEGLVSTPNGAEVLAFLKFENSTTPVEEQPDIEIISVGLGPQADFGYGVRAEGLKDEIYEKWLKPLENYENFTILLAISLLHPKSTGKLELRSSNPLDSPKLFANFFKEPEDLETILKGIKFITKLIETPPLKSIDAKFHKIPIPPCEKFKFGSENYWKCAVRIFSLSFHHQVGTCRMGRDEKTSVVDSKLRVFGVRGLRVVDTSIIPAATSGHTNALSFMIGERAVEFIEEGGN